VFCAASDWEADGVAVLAFGPGEVGDPFTVPCGTATPLDLRKGKLGWQGKFTPPQNVSPDKVRSGAALEIVGDMVVIAQDEGMVGLDRADGTQKWAKDVQHQKTGELGCKAYDMVATGKDVVVGQSCINETGIVTFSRIDPATGETTQTADYSSSVAGSRLEFPAFVSADPLIAWMSETTRTASSSCSPTMPATMRVPSRRMAAERGRSSSGPSPLSPASSLLFMDEA
jgi:outer membrane protein assembly factor BamB